jgi:hypothetical protein
MNFGTSCVTRMRIAPILFLTGQKVFHCGPVAEHGVLWTGT